MLLYFLTLPSSFTHTPSTDGRRNGKTYEAEHEKGTETHTHKQEDSAVVG